MTFLTAINIEMPDGTLLELDVNVTAEYEHNPFGKEKPPYAGEDDGWTVIEIQPR